MLLLHGNLAAIPAIADLRQTFLDQVQTDGFGREIGEGLGEQLFCLNFVEDEAGIDPGSAQAGDNVAVAEDRTIGEGMPGMLIVGTQSAGCDGRMQGVGAFVFQTVPKLDRPADAHALILAFEHPFQRVDIVL